MRTQFIILSVKILLLVFFTTSVAFAFNERQIQDSELQQRGASSTIEAFVSIEDRKLYVYKNKKRIRSYSIGVGKEGYETPVGEFAINSVDWNPDWMPPDSEWSRNEIYRRPGDPENPLGLVRMVFKPTYNVHGTLEHWSVGRASSRGCIRLKNTDVINLARLLMNETGTKYPDDFFDNVLNNRFRMERVQLSESVPFTVKNKFEGDIYLPEYTDVELYSRIMPEPRMLQSGYDVWMANNMSESLPGSHTHKK